MEVSVIIVNYNTKGLTINCIESVLYQTYDISYEIIVVDNASTDGSQLEIKEKFPDVILIESKINLGFGKANNVGLHLAKGKYIFFLNSDTQLKVNSIKLFFDFYEKYGSEMKIGCLGGWLLENGSYVLGEKTFPTFRAELRKVIQSYLSKVFFYKSQYEVDKDLRGNGAEQFFKVEYVCGANLFIARIVLDRIGAFDERFFMFYEETDLQKRMEDVGLHRYILQGSVIQHESGASFGKKGISNWRRKIANESMLKYFYKHNPSYKVRLFQIVLVMIYLPVFFIRNYKFSENLEFLKLLIKSYRTE